MGNQDKLSNKAQEVKGNIKEAVGDVTGNKDLENKGRADQAKAAAKDLGEDVKDTFGKVKDAVTKR